MIDTKAELTIARAMLSAKAEVILSRERREQRIREKAVEAYSERQKSEKRHKPMTAEERKAVMDCLKNLKK